MKYSNIDWKFVFWHSYGLLVSTVAAFALVTMLSMLSGGQVRFAATHGDHVVIMDFLQFYAGAYLGGHSLGMQANIYDPAVQLAAVNAVIAPQKMATGFILQYPPYVYLMLIPLAAVSMLPAWMLSNAVGFVCLCATVWLVTQGMKPPSRAFVLAAAAICAPSLNCLFEGQLLSPVLMLALLLVWACVWIYRWLECSSLSGAARYPSIIVRATILALPLLSLVYGGMASMFYVPISTIIVALCLSILYLERHAEFMDLTVCSLVR